MPVFDVQVLAADGAGAPGNPPPSPGNLTEPTVPGAPKAPTKTKRVFTDNAIADGVEPPANLKRSLSFDPEE